MIEILRQVKQKSPHGRRSSQALHPMVKLSLDLVARLAELLATLQDAIHQHDLFSASFCPCFDHQTFELSAITVTWVADDLVLSTRSQGASI